MNGIRGKKIMFFCPRFFKYEEHITRKLQKMGADINWFDQRSVQGSIGRAILKIHPKLLMIQSQIYYSKIINSNISEIDYLFVIEGQMIPINIIKKIKKNSPNVKIILYLWDSVSNIRGIRNKLQYFDAIYSYDQQDCEKYENMIFRPLFFIDEYTKKSKNDIQKKYDIASIGTMHSDRYSIVKKIRQYVKHNDKRMFEFNYLQKKWVFYFKKIVNKEYRKANIGEFSFKKMKSSDIVQISDMTIAILDAQHPKNVGLTMRTFEMMAAQKKIITTNPNIRNYDFYNRNNIFVFDRSNKKVDIPTSFFETDFSPINETTLMKYSIDEWVNDIFSDDYDKKFLIDNRE